MFYRYFPSKADLVALMIDSAGESPLHLGKPSLPWSTRLKEWARRCLAIYRDHPWFLEATSARQTLMGPNELSWMETALEMLPESGLGSKERHHAFLTIIGHVRGHATFQHIEKHNGLARNGSRNWLNFCRQKPIAIQSSLRLFVREHSVKTSAVPLNLDLIASSKELTHV